MWQMGVNGCGRSKERARLLGAINKLLDGYVFKQNGEIPQQRPRRAAGPRRILYPFDDAACWQEAPGRRVGVAVAGKAAADGCHVIVAIHVAASLHKHDLTLAFLFIYIYIFIFAAQQPVDYWCFVQRIYMGPPVLLSASAAATA